MAGQMPTLPDFTMMPFDGSGAGARFLMTLSIKLQNVDTQTWPGLWIQAVYIQVTGNAAVWMDTTPHVVSLVRSLKTVTVAQREAFDREFAEQFPGTQVDPTQPQITSNGPPSSKDQMKHSNSTSSGQEKYGAEFSRLQTPRG
ncbi:hypothetical protein K3495_g13639 [Podosphaera aphanis]|nr:hypothetical protein K3495_g13639 [Podosphaera aphanis]